MAFYESVIIARQDASTAQVDGLQDTFAALLEGMNGKVTKREYWGLRNLAFRIKKNRKGHYVLFNIDAGKEAIAELDRQLRLNEDILRHLIVRVDELEEGQSVQMQKPASRDERPRRGGAGRPRREGEE